MLERWFWEPSLKSNQPKRENKSEKEKWNCHQFQHAVSSSIPTHQPKKKKTKPALAVTLLLSFVVRSSADEVMGYAVKWRSLGVSGACQQPSVVERKLLELLKLAVLIYMMPTLGEPSSGLEYGMWNPRLYVPKYP